MTNMAMVTNNVTAISMGTRIEKILGTPFFSRKFTMGKSRYDKNMPKVKGYKKSFAIISA
jgi:hypothetical protein